MGAERKDRRNSLEFDPRDLLEGKLLDIQVCSQTFEKPPLCRKGFNLCELSQLVPMPGKQRTSHQRIRIIKMPFQRACQPR
jgi:hypothetical protein